MWFPSLRRSFKIRQCELPLLTRFVIGTAHFFARFWWLCVLVIVALGMLLASYIRTPGGRLVWDRLKLRLPLVGDLLGKASILRFAQTLGTLLRGGVPILVSLKLVQEHAENSVLAGELAQVYAAVDQGSRLEVPLRQVDGLSTRSYRRDCHRGRSRAVGYGALQACANVQRRSGSQH